MAKLIINVPGMPASEIELMAGTNRFGRSLNTDFRINHPSVSGSHCEIVDTNGALSVKDLGSTNGTYIDGIQLQEGPLSPGQTLRLGEVVITFAPEFATVPAIKVTLDALPPPPAHPSPLPRRPVSLLPIRKSVNFYKSIPGAFVFPFRGNGPILLVAGTIFFLVINFMSRRAGMFAFGLGLALGVFSCGYLFAFQQSVVNTTAMGDDEMPGWPEFDSWLDNGLGPFVQLVGILLICLGPAFIYTRFATSTQEWVTVVLWLGGCLYLPMAFLAVTMYDTLAALNPILIVLSIIRVPFQYAATCSVIGSLVLMVGASNWVDENLKIPVIPQIVDEFLFLYTLTVIARLAGLLFYTTQDRLGWEMRQK